mmetsp:Transcript_22853/g.38169  ORF Transcript_22853/g.38169 Transcript_22853/m.38169 type:complete len:316 (+) Transcript_22853:850-1797(+)
MCIMPRPATRRRSRNKRNALPASTSNKCDISDPDSASCICSEIVDAIASARSAVTAANTSVIRVRKFVMAQHSASKTQGRIISPITGSPWCRQSAPRRHRNCVPKAYEEDGSQPSDKLNRCAQRRREEARAVLSLLALALEHSVKWPNRDVRHVSGKPLQSEQAAKCPPYRLPLRCRLCLKCELPEEMQVLQAPEHRNTQVPVLRLWRFLVRRQAIDLSRVLSSHVERARRHQSLSEDRTTIRRHGFWRIHPVRYHEQVANVQAPPNRLRAHHLTPKRAKAQRSPRLARQMLPWTNPRGRSRHSQVDCSCPPRPA